MLAFLQTIISNNSLVKTYTRPSEIVTCKPVSLSTLLHILPLFIQCSLLYPYFDRFRWARRVRLALTPLSVYFSLTMPIEYCFTPTSRRGYPNLVLACASFPMAARAIEWGTLKSYQDGKLSKRPEFLSSRSHSTPNSGHTPGPPSSSSQAQETHQFPASFSFQDWLAWSLELQSSVRGQQYGWGIKIPPHTEGVIDLVKRMYMLNILHVFVTAYAILCRDHGSAKNALRHLGLPEFYGNGLLGEGLWTLAFGFYLITMVELGFGYLTLLVHLINFVDCKVIGLPDWLMRTCDLRLYAPLFIQPHRAQSLAQLWGKSWHQLFRQGFLIFAGVPAGKLAKRLGLGPKVQKLAGMCGCFLASAVLHEYVIHFVARQPHSHPHIFLGEFPGSFMYFMLQPLGILAEPYVIPWIPGGGMVWNFAFTLLTALPFRKAFFPRLVDQSYPSVSRRWLITSLLVPSFTARG